MLKTLPKSKSLLFLLLVIILVANTASFVICTSPGLNRNKQFATPIAHKCQINFFENKRFGTIYMKLTDSRSASEDEESVVQVYSAQGCKFCAMAKAKLR
jgi:thioredoxin-related protein